MKPSVCLLLALSLGMGSGAAAASTTARSQVEMHTTSRYVVSKGSTEYRAIAEFIAARIAPYRGRYGSVDGLAPNVVGDTFMVTLDYSRSAKADSTASNVTAPSPPPAPWYPDTQGATGGDTASVSTCSQLSRTSQTWGFTYMRQPDGSYAWVVTRYNMVRVTRCSTGR